jgi:hypothetical protein
VLLPFGEFSEAGKAVSRVLRDAAIFSEISHRAILRRRRLSDLISRWSAISSGFPA